MQLDIEDVLAGSIGRVITTALFFISAIWLGSLVGGLAWMIGKEHYRGASDLIDLLEAFCYSPLLLINLWIIPNIAFLAVILIYVLVSDGISHLTWGLIVGMESLFVMLGWCLKFDDLKEPVISWSCWILLLGMAETGLWLHCQMRRNRWVRAMAELSAENAMLRAQRAEISSNAGRADENPI